jgi:excisionase family DNA binding protein
MTDTELLTSADAARVASVTPATVRGWTSSGALPSVTTPSGQRIIRRADLDAYIERREQCQPKS